MSDNINIFPNASRSHCKDCGYLHFYCICKPLADLPAPPVAKRLGDSTILSGVIADLRAREAKGIQTYGTTLETAKLTRRQRLQHIYEEQLDAALYIKNEIMALDNEALNG